MLWQVAQWILSQGWTVGDLWNKLVEYSTSRSKGETKVGFFRWLLPSIYGRGGKAGLSAPHRPAPKTSLSIKGRSKKR